MTAGWDGLTRELDAWAAAGRTAALWWRDDDAGAPCPALERLLDLAAESGAPLALAVIPARAGEPLAATLERHAADTAVLQHGVAHANHAPAGAKNCELVDPARRPELPAELRRCRRHLEGLFGARFRPVMVPPWNRIAETLIAALPALGFAGLSTYKARAGGAPLPGLQQVNCHVDILQWRPERRFVGSEAALALLTGHLAAKRAGTADAGEPSGILSHHQVHDAAAWDFLAALLNRLARHPAVRLLPAEQVFAAPPAAAGTAVR
ncbi:MAG: polysaccharide deacetylase family protein [Kiloniellaceae bacterium]